VLIVGEYSGDSMARMMSLIESFILCNQSHFRFIYKPHPACHSDIPVSIKSVLHVTRAPLQKIFPNAHLVIGGNSTSGVIDALIYGLPVIVYHDQCQLNLSPLFGVKSTKFFSNIEELTSWMHEMSIHLKCSNNKISDSFFYTGKKLSRWDSLLSNFDYS
jgi:surface carbohydrate biosynthesis protein (TIGR04326 family)